MEAWVMSTDTYRRTALRRLLVFLLASTACSPRPTAPAASTSSAATASPPSQRVQFQRGRTLVDAKTLSLDELISRAHRIFVGRIDTIEEQNVVLPEGSTAKGRVVIITVEESLKGPVTAGQPLTIKQLLSISAPLKAGEKILWFLPQEGASGLVQPLGIYSGDFRIDTQRQDAPATNLKLNQGLWHTTLAAEGFDRALILAEAKNLKMSPAAVSRMAKAFEEKPQADAVPLSLLIAAIRSKAKP
jgi:hypothetical protein